MGGMKLWASLASPFVRKVRIVLAEKAVPCELALVDVAPAEHAAVAANPLGKIPALVLDEGATLYDSRVIVEYLDCAYPHPRLLPEHWRTRVEVRRWEALADGVLDAGVLVRYESQRPPEQQSAQWTDKQLGKVRRGLDAMEAGLGARGWCVGDGYTLADVALACALGWLEFRRPGGIDWRAGRPNLVRHYEALLARPAIAQTAPRERLDSP